MDRLVVDAPARARRRHAHAHGQGGRLPRRCHPVGEELRRRGLPLTAHGLDEEHRVQSVRGEREIPASEFFVDWMTSSLEPDALRVGVRVPKLGAGWGVHYEKLHRTAPAWASVGVACALRPNASGVADGHAALRNRRPAPHRARPADPP
ncbi:hypothetical protein HUX53_00160, partial [Actinomadura sp. BRA 177]|nr:hypothetical protein [Actinomadura sp. BRA 177]